jgi:APA family basic amino acid/polyamine antiporter
LIGMVAALNGALIQIIMAARVLYGLAAQGWLPKPLGYINPHTRTPLIATLLATAIVLLMALIFPLVTLAQVTALITLVIFATVNLALLRVKSRGPAPPDHYVVPSCVPALGLIASVAFALYQIVQFAR